MTHATAPQLPGKERVPRSLAAQGSHGKGLPGLFWIVAYIGLAAFPLAILLLGPMPRGGGFWWDFSMALGFGGLAIMGLQFVLTARFRRLFAPFGIDIIYYFHRWIAIGGTTLIVAHYLIIRLLHPESLGPADPRVASWHLTAGRLALLAILALVVTSLWRRTLRLHYDGWRVGHALLAATAIILAIVHVHGVGHYTAAPWKNALWLSYSVAWVAVLGHIRLIKPALLLRRPYRVTSVKPERGASWTVTLRPATGGRLSFSPGQFAWLSLGTNPFRMKEHPFSFSGSAESPDEVQFTIKELGDFTRTIKNLPVGTVAYVDGPYGRFTTDLHPEAAGFVFIAGGVGIAPIMSMLRTLADRGDRRPLHLVYGNWRRPDTLFLDELDALANRLNLQVTHVLQQPPADWPGEVGLIAEPVLARVLPPEATGYPCFVCGPKAMTDYVLPSLRSLGFPLRNQHTELFEMV